MSTSAALPRLRRSAEEWTPPQAAQHAPVPADAGERGRATNCRRRAPDLSTKLLPTKPPSAAATKAANKLKERVSKGDVDESEAPAPAPES